jgi:hypothetical protein
MTFQGFSEEEEPQKVQDAPVGKHPSCPKCESDKTGEVDLGRHKVFFCSACSYRERKPGQPA